MKCIAAVFFFQVCNTDPVLDCATECVRCYGPRSMSDANCTIQWLTDNYDAEWDSVFLLHNGPQQSWHRTAPLTKQPFSYGLSNKKMTDIEKKKDTDWEYPMLLRLAHLFGRRTVNGFIAHYQLHMHQCCNEAYVHHQDLRLTPLKQLKQISKLINTHPNEPWGWVLERVLPLLLHLKLT